jgi:hypothetical protein
VPRFDGAMDSNLRPRFRPRDALVELVFVITSILHVAFGTL